MSLASPGGVPEIISLARKLGDFSSVYSYAAQGNARAITRRVQNKILGRAGGKSFGFMKATFGVVGMVAFAEFLHLLKQYIAVKSSEPIWLGTMADYATEINEGFTDLGGKHHPARPFWDKAILTAEHVRSKSRVFTGYFKPPAIDLSERGGGVTIGSATAGTRAGLYEGQKFIGDIQAFARGDIARIARREAGRETASFFWGTLSEKTRNPLEKFARIAVREARKNCTDMGILDKGVLRASITYGLTEFQFKQNSLAMAVAQMRKEGIEHEFLHRMDVMSTGSYNLYAGQLGMDSGVGKYVVQRQGFQA